MQDFIKYSFNIHSILEQGLKSTTLQCCVFWNKCIEGKCRITMSISENRLSFHYKIATEERGFISTKFIHFIWIHSFKSITFSSILSMLIKGAGRSRLLALILLCVLAMQASKATPEIKVRFLNMGATSEGTLAPKTKRL